MLKAAETSNASGMQLRNITTVELDWLQKFACREHPVLKVDHNTGKNIEYGSREGLHFRDFQKVLAAETFCS